MNKLLLVCALLLQLLSSSLAAKELHVSLLLINGNQRNAYHTILERFSSENPDIELFVKDFESEYYKSQIKNWLSSEKHSDVMYWFSGQRLREFVAQGWVKNLDALWHESGWSNQFTLGAQSSVTSGQHRYGLPVHYYPWGIYYNKSLFKRLNISEPHNWEQFLQACEILAENDITPIVLGSKYKWTLAGWFDYLNLRINGLNFHQDLISGKASYKDPRVAAVFEHWKVLIDKGYFLPNHEKLTWREVVPYLYRNVGGMTLLGNFWTSDIPPSVYKDIGMFSFPVINSDVPTYEEAPTDVFIIPDNVQNEPEARRFLQFMASPTVQADLNRAVGMMAPNPQSVESDDHLLNTSYEILNQAAGLSQFYDRDNPEPISLEGMEQFAKFVADPNQLDDVLDELEALRKVSFEDL